MGRISLKEANESGYEFAIVSPKIVLPKIGLRLRLPSFYILQLLMFIHDSHSEIGVGNEGPLVPPNAKASAAAVCREERTL